MPRNRLSSHKLIEAFCERLNVKYDDMASLIKPLLQQYNSAKGDRDNIFDLVTVQGGKNEYVDDSWKW